MKKKTTIVLSAVIALILLLTIVPVALGVNFSTFFELGKYQTSERNSKEGETIVASYKDELITKGMIEYHHKTYELSVKELESSGFDNEAIAQMGIIPKTDEEITNNILCGLLLLEEAEKAGLAATEKEVEEWLVLQKRTYEDPASAKQIDAFCEGAGITLEEHWNRLSEEAYGTLSRKNLRKRLKETYYNDQSLDINNLSQDDVSAYNEFYQKYCAALLEAHKSEIVYYIDTTE